MNHVLALDLNVVVFNYTIEFFEVESNYIYIYANNAMSR